MKTSMSCDICFMFYINLFTSNYARFFPQYLENPCLINNGGCSHFCLATATDFFCKCPDNMELNETDTFTCQPISRKF